MTAVLEQSASAKAASSTGPTCTFSSSPSDGNLLVGCLGTTGSYSGQTSNPFVDDRTGFQRGSDSDYGEICVETASGHGTGHSWAHTTSEAVVGWIGEYSTDGSWDDPAVIDAEAIDDNGGFTRSSSDQMDVTVVSSGLVVAAVAGRDPVANFATDMTWSTDATLVFSDQEGTTMSLTVAHDLTATNNPTQMDWDASTSDAIDFGAASLISEGAAATSSIVMPRHPRINIRHNLVR